MSEQARPLLYVAAPYTRPDPVVNTNAVCRVATILYEQTSWVPVVPHLSLLWHAITPKPIEFWYELDVHHMRACTGFLRLPGESTGADDEAKIADREGLTFVYFEFIPEDARRIWLESRAA